MSFILFFGVTITLAALSRDKFFLQLLIIACALFMSLRGMDTPDTAAYFFWYEFPPIKNNHVEQGYAWLCYYAFTLEIPFRIFIFFKALLEMEIWLYCSKKLFPKANYNLLFALCLCFYGIYFWGCVLRASMAITIGYIAMSGLLTKRKIEIKDYVFFFALIFFASTIHVSSLIYVFCPLFKYRLKQKQIIIIIISCIGCIFLLNILGASSYINSIIGSVQGMDKFQNYTGNETDKSFISLFWIIPLVICCLIAKRFRYLMLNNTTGRINNFFCNLYLCGFVLLTITNKIPAGSRLGMMYTFFEFIIIYKLAKTYRSQIGRIAIYSGYILLRFTYMIHSIPLFLKY